MTLFSKRYARALMERRLVVDSFSMRTRNRTWQMMERFDDWWEVGFNESTSHVDETAGLLRREYGMGQLEAYTGDGEARGPVDLKSFVARCYKSQFLDVIEAFHLQVKADDGETFQAEINRIFSEENVPWRMSGGQFFQLDSRFLDAEALARTEELLHSGGFAGALDEFREARSDLTAGDVKSAIAGAQRAYESTMKTILGVSDGNASSLIRQLVSTDFFGDLPANTQASFGESVLMALPFMGNRLGRHGQGEDVVDVPRHYGELALHVAGSFIRLLVERHLERDHASLSQEPTPVTGAAPSADDDIPF